jgi:hypothetical protein
VQAEELSRPTITPRTYDDIMMTKQSDCLSSRSIFLSLLSFLSSLTAKISVHNSTYRSPAIDACPAVVGASLLS